MSNDSVRYATKLAEEYGVDLTPKILKAVKSLNTIGEVATQVLPQDKLNQWLEAEKDESYRLRKKFNLKPYDAMKDVVLRSQRS